MKVSVSGWVLGFVPPAVPCSSLEPGFWVWVLFLTRPPSPLPAKPGLAALVPLVEPRPGTHKRCFTPNDKAKLGQVGRLGD